MFDVERFVADCQQAVADDDSHKAVREVVDRAVSEPGRVMAALGEPSEAGLTTLHRADDLTVLSIAWAPEMTLMPHNHNMWALIGIYSGREDNIFWRRRGDRVEAAGAKALAEGDVAALGRDLIHSVTNPIPRMTCAIHVYGGDFFAPGRSEWDPETLTERPFDMDANRRRFQAANLRFAAGQNG